MSSRSEIRALAEAMKRLPTRIRRKIVLVGECWVWTGSRKGSGYGQVWIDNAVRAAHRVIWEMLRGPIPSGLTMDHLCRQKPCVNPSHLEPVTLLENIMRSDTITAIYARRNTCSRGHNYQEMGTVRDKGGKRRCYKCTAIHRATARAKGNR